MKKQTDIAKKNNFKEWQGLWIWWKGINKTINKDDKKITTLKKYSQIYFIAADIVFTNIIISKKFDKFYFKSKYSDLAKFYYNVDKRSRLKTQKENRGKTNVYDTASELYNY